MRHGYQLVLTQLLPRLLTCAERHDRHCRVWLQVQLLDDLEDPRHRAVAAAGQDAQPGPHQCRTRVALLLLLQQVGPDLPQHLVWPVL